MKDLQELSKLFPPNALARDIIYALTGICILLVSTIIYPYNVLEVPFIVGVGATERAVSLLAIAYVLSRALKEVGESVTDIILFGFSSEKAEVVKRKLQILVSNSASNQTETTNSTSQAELDEFISKNKGAALNHERMVQAEILVQIVLGVFVALFLTLNLTNLAPVHIYSAVAVASFVLFKAIVIRIYLLEMDAEFADLLQRTAANFSQDGNLN